MSDFVKGYISAIITIFVSSLLFYAVSEFSQPSAPDGESLVIEYTNPIPYKRTLGVEIVKSITNSFKICHYHMEKYKYRVSLYNPKENEK